MSKFTKISQERAIAYPAARGAAEVPQLVSKQVDALAVKIIEYAKTILPKIKDSTKFTQAINVFAQKQAGQIRLPANMQGWLPRIQNWAIEVAWNKTPMGKFRSLYNFGKGVHQGFSGAGYASSSEQASAQAMKSLSTTAHEALLNDTNYATSIKSYYDEMAEMTGEKVPWKNLVNNLEKGTATKRELALLRQAEEAAIKAGKITKAPMSGIIKQIPGEANLIRRNLQTITPEAKGLVQNAPKTIMEGKLPSMVGTRPGIQALGRGIGGIASGLGAADAGLMAGQGLATALDYATGDYGTENSVGRYVPRMGDLSSIWKGENVYMNRTLCQDWDNAQQSQDASFEARQMLVGIQGALSGLTKIQGNDLNRLFTSFKYNQYGMTPASELSRLVYEGKITQGQSSAILAEINRVGAQNFMSAYGDPAIAQQKLQQVNQRIGVGQPIASSTKEMLKIAALLDDLGLYEEADQIHKSTLTL